jgi:hypothetical protein
VGPRAVLDEVVKRKILRPVVTTTTTTTTIIQINVLASVQGVL